MKIRAGTTGTLGRSELALVSSPPPGVTAAPNQPSGPKKSRLWRRCVLCGLPSHGSYCNGHSWAYGEVIK